MLFGQDRAIGDVLCVRFKQDDALKTTVHRTQISGSEKIVRSGSSILELSCLTPGCRTHALFILQLNQSGLEHQQLPHDQ